MSKLTTLLRYLNTPKRYSSRKKIAKIQNKAVQKHVKFVRQNSKFYRELWQGYTDEEWRNFPIIDKAMMMENLQDLITVDLDITNARDLAERAEKAVTSHPKLVLTPLVSLLELAVFAACILLANRNRQHGQDSCLLEGWAPPFWANIASD